MTDHELLISTLREAGRIIGEPGTRDAEQTLSRLVAVLDSAVERLEKGNRLHVVK
jgi:hypothetical protein